MDALIGRTLKDRFQITSPLGEGAMGTVYRGVDTSSGRDVAIKIMHPGLMSEPGMLSRFRREATAMRQVEHPNAVKVIAYGVDSGWVFLVMELVLGQDLAERMYSKPHLTPERSVRIVSEVLSALGEAHSHGIVHRDIKPENIMLAGPMGETVKLIDFGIAKPTALHLESEETIADDASVDDSIPDDVDLLGGFDLTSAGTLVGSPGYMAPEQWSSHGVDGRTDIYACGVLLYQLVTGRFPFEAENPFILATLQLKQTPTAPHELNPAVHPSLSPIILRALSPNPEHRYQSASAMRDALCAHLVEITISEVIGFGETVAANTPSPYGISGAVAARLTDKNRLLGELSESLKNMKVPDECAPTQPMPILLPEPLSNLAASEMLRSAPKVPKGAFQVATATPADTDVALASKPSHSVGRSGRKTPSSPFAGFNPANGVALQAQVAIAPSLALRPRNAPVTAARPKTKNSRHVALAMRALLSSTPIQLGLPLVAAFFALGVALGILLFLPAF